MTPSAGGRYTLRFSLPAAPTAMSRAPTSAPLAARLAVQEEGVLLVVSLGRGYGLRMEAVREVVPVPPAHRLPGAPEAVAGLVNVRGRIVTVLDLAAVLGGSAPETAESRLVLLEHRGRVVGVSVDEVRRLVRVDPDTLLPVGEDAHEIVYGIGESEGDEFGMIDLDALLVPFFE